MKTIDQAAESVGTGSKAIRFSRLAAIACLSPMLCLFASGCGSRATTRQQLEEPEQKSDAAPKLASRDGRQVTDKTVVSVDREAKIARARELVDEQDFDGAASTLRELLLVKPNDVEVLFRLANVEAAGGNLRAAIDLLGEIREDDPVAGIPALGQSADWCMQSQRYDEAEQRYLKVLEQVPQAARARRQLAYLLNRQGRRQEASAHIRELCKLGNVRQDELRTLINVSDAIYDDPSKPQESDGDRPYWPIGPGGEARYLFGQTEFEEVVAILHRRVESGEAHPSMLALYGRAAAESQDDDRFVWWLLRTDDRTKTYGDYWAAIGVFESSKRRYASAARALAEAIDRDPTDYLSMGRLRQCLSTLGDEEMSKRWYDRWLAIRETAKANNRLSDPPDPDAIAELASLLFHLDRSLEAALWKSIEGFHRKSPQSELLQWSAEQKHLVANGTGFPSQSDRLCGMDLSQYPLPSIDASNGRELAVSPRESESENPTPARFEDIASDIGLKHTYRVASRPQSKQYAIYQTLGGGVAVLDYDRDGASDLYFAQGGADPPSFQGQRTNQLFRKVDTQLVDVTKVSQTVETQYSIGLTAGDWNQDGFPDLVVANIGEDQLLINNGDGTFTRQTLSRKASRTRVPASAAMADVTGDALPDIFQTVYVDDADLDQKPLLDGLGRVVSPVSPGDFDLGPDKLIENDGRGGFEYRELRSKDRGAYAGLGVVVADLDDDLGNEVFVGNDLYPNQLWVRDSDTGQWSDAAPILGCAYGFTGLATGSMGIATGDFDKNGSLDIHVTNYEEENASLYMGDRGAYEDRNVEFKLGKLSNRMVGFGTEAIDYDNDDDADLVITNGHLDDALENDSSFKQPAQLLCNLGDRFQLAEVKDLSDYWNEDHLGRGLARLDFNRDGRSDFVITHIGEPSALLLNKTLNDHHWLQLELVGTVSERDSTGAQIRLRFDGKERTDWVVAGDGYLSHNEATVAFGLGESTRVEEIEILWPSGSEQVIRDVPANHRWLIIENQSDPYLLDPSP